MGNPNFRVTIPENAQEFGGLSQRVLDKHVVDGPTSVLNPLNMAEMQAKTTLAQIRDGQARQLNSDKETAYQARDNALGVDTGNPGVVDFYVKSARDILLGVYKGREQKLGDHGFEVNRSGGGITVVIPTNAPKLMSLAALIIAKHVADGPASPIAGLDTVDFTGKNATAQAQHTLATQLNRDKEKAVADRDTALGIAVGQKTDTPSTVKFYVISSRDVLLGFNKGQEHNLGDWGYDVQFSSAPGAPTGTFKATPSSISVGDSSTLDWNISGAASIVIDNGIGTVGDSGSQIVTPAVTTTYKLTATASGGSTMTITVTITVT